MSEPLKLSLNRAIPMLTELATKQSPLSLGSLVPTMNNTALKPDIRNLSKTALLGTTRMLSTGLDILGVVDVMSGMVEDLRTQVASLERMVQGLNGEKARIIIASNGTRDRLNTEIAGLEQSKQALQGEKQTLANELGSARQALGDAQVEMKRQVDDLTGKNSDLQREISLGNAQNTGLRDQIKSGNVQNKGLTDQIKLLVPQIEAAERQLKVITDYLRLKPEEADKVTQAIFALVDSHRQAAARAIAQAQQVQETLRQNNENVAYVSKAVQDIVELLCGERDDFKIDWAIQRIGEMKAVLVALTEDMGLLPNLDNMHLALEKVRDNMRMLKENGPQIGSLIDDKAKALTEESRLKRENKVLRAQLLQYQQSVPQAAAGPVQAQAAVAQQQILYFNSPADLKQFMVDNPDETDPQLLVPIRDYLSGFPVIGPVMAAEVNQILKESENVGELHSRLVGRLMTLGKNSGGNDMVMGARANEFLNLFDPSNQIIMTAAPQANAPVVIAGEDRKTVSASYFSIVTDLGTKRDHNEDAAGHAILPDGTEVFIVCDGMGGHAAGDVAARIGVAQYISARSEGISQIDAFIAANQVICEEIAKDGAKKGMGSTLVVLEIDRKNGFVHVLHTGDARAKGVDPRRALTLSRDHSLKMEIFNSDFMQAGEDPDMVEQRKRVLNVEFDDAILGKIMVPKKAVTDEEIEAFDNFDFPQKNIVTSGLGGMNYSNGRINPPVKLNMVKIPIRPSSDMTTFLIYSDGAVDGSMTEGNITAIVRDNNDPAVAAQGVMEAALANGSADNVTVAAVNLPCLMDVDNIMFQELVLNEDQGMYINRIDKLRMELQTAAQSQAQAQTAQAQAAQATAEQLAAIASHQPIWKKRVVSNKINRGFFSSDLTALTHYYAETDMTADLTEALLVAVSGYTKSKVVNIHLANNLRGTELKAFLPAIEAELKRLKKKFTSDIYIYQAGNNGMGIIFDKLPPDWQQHF